MSVFDSTTSSEREMSIDTPIEDHSESTESSGSLRTPTISRLRRAKTTWDHTRNAIGLEPKRGGKKKDKIFYCNYCTTYSSYVSTTFRNHLLKAHDVHVVTQIVHPVKKTRTSLLRDVFAKAGKSDISKLDGHEEQVLRNALNPNAVVEALVQLVTVRNLPYNCSQWPELHALLMAVNYTAEDVISLSHGAVQTLVSNSYSIHKDILRKKLQSSLSELHLSADVWSAPNHKAFLGTCVQFVDNDKKETRQALLALSELPGLDGPGSHGGAEQWKLLKSVLEDYKIWNKIGYFTGDNHGSNDVLCAALGNFLEEKGITWQPKRRRIRCHGHVINLIVQAFLFMDSKTAVEAACKLIEELDEASYDVDMIQAWKKRQDLGWREMGALGKVHNTALHIRADNFRYNQFKKRAGQVLPLDNDTRWNSWYHLLNVTLEKQEHVKRYQEENFEALKDDCLSIEDWKTLRDTREFLQPFWRITQITESHKTTLDSTLFTMDVLRKHFDHAIIKHKDHTHLLGCILTSREVFCKYYRLSDDNPVYAAALILHPSRRKAHIQKNWQKSWHKKAFDSVKKLWEDDYKEMIMIDDPSLIITDQEPDGYDVLARELDVVGGALDIDEYETFTSQKPISIDCSPLTWWLRDEQQNHYPNLSNMASDILSIPAMSADPERVFSGARRTISWDRMLLGAATIEKGECLKSWIRSGITRGLPEGVINEVLETEVSQEKP
jgi:hypothetical protein